MVLFQEHWPLLQICFHGLVLLCGCLWLQAAAGADGHCVQYADMEASQREVHTNLLGMGYEHCGCLSRQALAFCPVEAGLWIPGASDLGISVAWVFIFLSKQGWMNKWDTAGRGTELWFVP